MCVIWPVAGWFVVVVLVAAGVGCLAGLGAGLLTAGLLLLRRPPSSLSRST